MVFLPVRCNNALRNTIVSDLLRSLPKSCLNAGLRMTEIVGIRFECLDYTNNSILIDKTLQYDIETK